MKIYLSLILGFFCFSFTQVKANIPDLTDTVSDIKIEDQKIIYQKNVLGKVEVRTDEEQSQKAKIYNVQIFGKNESLVAEYEVEVLSKQKKNQDAILSAQVKTIKDNVIHNGTNFIDFHLKSAVDIEDAVLQLDKVIKYLLEYKYL